MYKYLDPKWLLLRLKRALFWRSVDLQKIDFSGVPRLKKTRAVFVHPLKSTNPHFERPQISTPKKFHYLPWSTQVHPDLNGGVRSEQPRRTIGSTWTQRGWGVIFGDAHATHANSVTRMESWTAPWSQNFGSGWFRMVFFFRMNFPPPEIEKFGDGFLRGNQVNWVSIFQGWFPKNEFWRFASQNKLSPNIGPRRQNHDQKLSAPKLGMLRNWKKKLPLAIILHSATRIPKILGE